MSQSRIESDRVFLRTQYALHFKRASRARFISEARADYVALFQFSESLQCSVGADAFELKKGGALLLDPGRSLSATGRNVEYLTLTVSPSFVLDCAARTGLVGAGATTGHWLSKHRSATLPAGTELTLELNRALTMNGTATTAPAPAPAPDPTGGSN